MEGCSLGFVELVVGPAFDIEAYNNGVSGAPGLRVRGKASRGIVDMDRQWNAVNFCFFVPRAADSYVRKPCTSRPTTRHADKHRGLAV